jgi:hypothetical protein
MEIEMHRTNPTFYQRALIAEQHGIIGKECLIALSALHPWINRLEEQGLIDSGSVSMSTIVCKDRGSLHLELDTEAESNAVFDALHSFGFEENSRYDSHGDAVTLRHPDCVADIRLNVSEGHGRNSHGAGTQEAA